MLNSVLKTWNNIKAVLRSPPLLFISVQLSGKAKVSAVLCGFRCADFLLRTLYLPMDALLN